MLMDEINVAVWLHAKSPSFSRSKEGDLPLLNLSNLTCMNAKGRNVKILTSLSRLSFCRLKYLLH